MKTASCKPSPDHIAALAEARLQVVVAYEDFETAVKVRNVLHHLLDDGPKDIGSTTAFWKFELFNYPALFDQAVTEAADAEFILLSLHGKCALPPVVTNWIKGWTSQRMRSPRLLLAVLDECAEYTDGTNDILACLNSLASAGGLEWIPIFSDSGDIPVFVCRGTDKSLRASLVETRPKS